MMINLIYQSAILILSIILYPWLKINKKTAPFLGERYGNKPVPAGDYYWFHGASLGEIQGLLPLIKLLRDFNPEARIIGTATSVKGYQQIATIADFASLLPIDHPIYIKKFIGNARIKKFVFGETEIWPSLINFLSAKQVPCYLVNGRLSEFNFKQYLFFKKYLAAVLNKLSGIFCISETYRKRFLELGVRDGLVKVTGNLKYDQAGVFYSESEQTDFRKIFFSNELPVLTLASIRPGEEAHLAAIIRDYRTGYNIIIAPRHAEKFSYFKDFLNAENIPFALKSAMNAPVEGGVVLLDTIGDLNRVYSFSAVSLIGGSLIAGIGGHNPMEAAPYRNVIMIGPEHQNQEDCVAALLDRQAIFVVKNEADIRKILKDHINLKIAGDAAAETWQTFQGKSHVIFREIFADA